jgi:hypothetical protein
MYRILMMMSLWATALYANENAPVAEELLPDSTGVCPISLLLTGETLSPSTGMFIVLSNDETPQNWIYVPLAKQNYL